MTSSVVDFTLMAIPENTPMFMHGGQLGMSAFKTAISAT